MSTPRLSILLLGPLIVVLLSLSRAGGSCITGPEQLLAEGAEFTWNEARSRSVQIQLRYRDKDKDGGWSRADLGSGFLISPDGLFVTAYHVMEYCLHNREGEYGFSVKVDCSTQHAALEYRAKNEGREFEVELISHLMKEDSIKGDVQTPDEIIKRRDFVIGRLKGAPGARFAHWPLENLEDGAVDPAYSGLDFKLKPLLPPKRVFIAGYPSEHDFSITHGFLNLTEDRRRGYFAADIPLYTDHYLKTQGIPADTQWGITVKNHMSGGAVVDLGGNVMGVVVNGDARTGAILSIENVLETFFARSAEPGTRPALILGPTETPLYLKRMPETQKRVLDRYSRIH